MESINTYMCWSFGSSIAIFFACYLISRTEKNVSEEDKFSNFLAFFGLLPALIGAALFVIKAILLVLSA